VNRFSDSRISQKKLFGFRIWRIFYTDLRILLIQRIGDLSNILARIVDLACNLVRITDCDFIVELLADSNLVLRPLSDCGFCFKFWQIGGFAYTYDLFPPPFRNCPFITPPPPAHCPTSPWKFRISDPFGKSCQQGGVDIKWNGPMLSLRATAENPAVTLHTNITQ
jgi:hypothetical protein